MENALISSLVMGTSPRMKSSSVSPGYTGSAAAIGFSMYRRVLEVKAQSASGDAASGDIGPAAYKAPPLRLPAGTSNIFSDSIPRSHPAVTRT